VGPDHPMRASLWHNLGSVRSRQGDHTRAAEHYLQAIEMRRRLGMRHDLGAALTALAGELETLGRIAEARAALEEADQLDREAHAEYGVRTGQPAFWLGKLAWEQGDLRGAREPLETAWVFTERAAEPIQRAQIAWMLGRTLWDLDVDPVRGHALVQQALTLAEGAPPDPELTKLSTSARRWLAEHASPPRP
jgi:tetratricopeptide (TPR) repeat protein